MLKLTSSLWAKDQMRDKSWPKSSFSLALQSPYNLSLFFTVEMVVKSSERSVVIFDYKDTPESPGFCFLAQNWVELKMNPIIFL